MLCLSDVLLTININVHTGSVNNGCRLNQRETRLLLWFDYSHIKEGEERAHLQKRKGQNDMRYYGLSCQIWL